MIDFCRDCDKRCCQTPAPIITEQERGRIVKETGKDFFVREGGYLIPGKENGFCKFLEKGLCSIQKIKPTDCSYYPLNPKFDMNGNTIFIIDKFCPAFDKIPAELLAKYMVVSSEFIQNFDLRVFRKFWGICKERVTTEIPMEDYLKMRGGGFKKSLRKELVKFLNEKNLTLETWAGKYKIQSEIISLLVK